MKKYKVTGMTCAACSARVEKAVLKVPGVTNCAVSLLTNSIGVEGTAETLDIINAVKAAGYNAFSENEKKYSDENEEIVDTETPRIKKRLRFSAFFLLVLMYFSMGHSMFGWPVPEYFEKNCLAQGLLQLLLTIIIMIINQKFFTSGFKSLWNRSPNMDTLVALGSGAAFVYSVYGLFAMTEAYVEGNASGAMKYMHELYFESAAMILTLITVGKMLEAHSKGKTTDALKGLMKLSPKTANVLRDDKEVTVSIEEVVIGDIFMVRPGESIPVDGVVIEGASAVNEAAFTGESVPVDKEKGNKVSAATINQSGFLKCSATRIGEDTTISQIIKMVKDAAATKAPIAKIADKVSGIFVPLVIVVALITLGIWLLVGESVGFALARGISVLVISCPCALGLATPVAIMVGNGVGARNGIMYKTAVSQEIMGKVEIVALDKTGTITKGILKVTDIICAENISRDKMLVLAASIEKNSEHPLGKAVLEYALEKELVLKNVEKFVSVAGNGLEGLINNEKIYGGNYRFVSSKVNIPNEHKENADILSADGKTPLYFAKESEFLGIIAVADTIKEESPEAIVQLKNMGIKVVMLTGDNERTAKAIGRQAGVDEVIAGVQPSEKERVIRRLKKKGKVAMVGDGINDAPALTRADVGVAIGAGTDIAIDAADVVLVKSKLTDVPAAIRLSRNTIRNIHQNLFWAFFYNAIGIPLAAGTFIALLGWELNPMFGAAAMSLSSFCVVTNALRLNFVKVYDATKDKKIKVKKKQEELEMEKTMIIEGMMCGHCEARVKKCLEALPQVDEAIVSHQEKTAVLKLNDAIENEVLIKTIEEQDYKVISVN